ncbi:hypothetical protein [Microlunatus sp. GCM10028923]|uniref:hypothetical protein n=1 Tax=Microlunatus sp. GCM10028923 TaxID=3273400 RepID=UPI0036239DF7
MGIDEGRAIIEDVRVTDLRIRSCLLNYAILRDVTIDGLTLDRDSGFCFANQFERVTVRGRVKGGALVLNRNSVQVGNYPELEAYTKFLADWDQGEGWTLDISEAEGEIEIRGYSADRIRLDLETQAVVRRRVAQDSLWKTVDYEDTAFGVAIEDMFVFDHDDTVLSANKASRNLPAELRVLQRLRDEGIAE